MSRVEDASSSSATHGSNSTTEVSDCLESELQQSDQVAAVVDKIEIREDNGCSNQHSDAPMRCGQGNQPLDGHPQSQASAIQGSHGYSLDRFVKEIDHRQKMLLGHSRATIGPHVQHVQTKSDTVAHDLGDEAGKPVEQGVGGDQEEDVSRGEDDTSA